MKDFIKKFNYVFMFAVMALCAVSFASCSDDDDDEPNPDVDQVVVGTYGFSHSGDGWSESATVKLNKNGKFDVQITNWYEEEGTEKGSKSGTFTAKNGTLTFNVTKDNWDDEDDVPYTVTGSYSSDGKTITIDGDVLTRK